MIHPDTELRIVSNHIGYGVFATNKIAKGTIVYIKDPLEIELNQQQFHALDENYRKIVEKYSYIDADGVHIMSWDIGKYVNHNCDFNTISTGYGFEIAVRDIQAGDEITDEYGLFNLAEKMELACGCPQCRGVLYPDDIDHYYVKWDGIIKDALACMEAAPQPLLSCMDKQTLDQVKLYLMGKKDYVSVYSLKYQRPGNAVKYIEKSTAHADAEMSALNVAFSHCMVD